MKGNFRRYYVFSIMVTAENVKSLSDMIAKDFKDVRYEIETKDGAQYKVQDINDILGYVNPDSRKIEVLRIRGNREEGESFFLPNICISLFDTSFYDKSIIIELNDMDEKEITYYSNRIDEFANRIKAPYWWIYKDNFYWVIGFSLYLAFSFVYLSNIDISTTANRVNSLLILSVVSAMCMLFSIYVLHKMVSLFYPESCFALGEQEKYKMKKEKARDRVFWSILVALLVGVMASVIGFYFVS